MRLKSKACVLGLTAFAGSIGACPSTLDHARTLRNPVPYLVENDHGHIASGDKRLSFVLPDFGSSGCGEMPDAKLSWNDSTGRLGLLLRGGEEYRYQESGLFATEFGGVAVGSKGLASFRMDARTFTEIGGASGRPSFDGESFDEQSRDVSGSLDYRSYSRFIGNLSFDLPFGTLTAARESAHWGPGIFGNLMLNQEAVPFYQYIFTTRLGPLQVTSLYGDLLPGSLEASSNENKDSRSLYAHRYELSLGSDWLFAVTEELILYDLSKPYLFAPIVPLFIAKGFLFEDYTNGNLGADLTWRSPWSTLFYSEFLLDDLESPSSLFIKDYSQNKWAALAGAHWEIGPATRRVGAILEASTVEPWVYAHFVPRTAQAANVGKPLGNPAGADSRSLIAKVYGRWNGNLYMGAKFGIYWKGKGASADLDSPAPKDPFTPKVRLEGAGTPDVACEPDLSYAWKRLSVYFSGRIGPGALARVGLQAFY